MDDLLSPTLLHPLMDQRCQSERRSGYSTPLCRCRLFMVECTGSGRRVGVLMAMIAVVAISCASAEFDRGDAVDRFETGGASSGQAECMADVLIELDQLHAFDPLVEPGEAGIAAMVSAGQLCVSTEVLSEVEQLPASLDGE